MSTPTPEPALNNGRRQTDVEVVRFEKWMADIGQARRVGAKTAYRGAWVYRHMPTQFAFIGWMASHNYPRVSP